MALWYLVFLKIFWLYCKNAIQRSGFGTWTQPSDIKQKKITAFDAPLFFYLFSCSSRYKLQLILLLLKRLRLVKLNTISSSYHSIGSRASFLWCSYLSQIKHNEMENIYLASHRPKKMLSVASLLGCYPSICSRSGEIHHCVTLLFDWPFSEEKVCLKKLSCLNMVNLSPVHSLSLLIHC